MLPRETGKAASCSERLVAGIEPGAADGVRSMPHPGFAEHSRAQRIEQVPLEQEEIEGMSLNTAGSGADGSDGFKGRALVAAPLDASAVVNNGLPVPFDPHVRMPVGEAELAATDLASNPPGGIEAEEPHAGFLPCAVNVGPDVCLRKGREPGQRGTPGKSDAFHPKGHHADPRAGAAAAVWIKVEV